MSKQLSAIEQLETRSNYDKTAFREMKKAEEENFFAIRDQSAQDVASSPAKRIEYLNTQANLYRLGAANLLAVAAQYPGAVVLKTAEEWRGADRQLKAGESPILIRQKDAHSGYTNIFHVYDLKQTEGRFFPLQQIALNENTVTEANQALYKNSRVQIVAASALEPPAFFDPSANLILVRSNLTHVEILKYLPHEIALSQLPREGYNREAYRTEAESVAYVIQKCFGADKLFAEYAKKTKQEDFAKLPDFATIGQVYEGFSTEEIISSLSFVRDQAYAMCNSVERSLNPQARQAFSRSPLRPSQAPAKTQPQER